MSTTTHVTRIYISPRKTLESHGYNVSDWSWARIHLKRLVAELIGTFLLTFTNAFAALGLSNTLASQPNPNAQITIASDAITSGLTLSGLIYALGPVSGAHFNPAVSLAFFLKGDMNFKSLVMYVLTQIGGGFFAAGILAAIFPNTAAGGYLGANHPAAGFTIQSAFWTEFIGSILLQLAILGTANRGVEVGSHAALAAGLTLAAIIAMNAPYGGASFNPARSLGPGMLASNPDIRGLTWIYVSAPFCAAVCTGLSLRWLLPKYPTNDTVKKEDGKDMTSSPALGDRGTIQKASPENENEQLARQA